MSRAQRVGPVTDWKRQELAETTLTLRFSLEELCRRMRDSLVVKDAADKSAGWVWREFTNKLYRMRDFLMTNRGLSMQQAFEEALNICLSGRFERSLTRQLEVLAGEVGLSLDMLLSKMYTQLSLTVHGTCPNRLIFPMLVDTSSTMPSRLPPQFQQYVPVERVRRGTRPRQIRNEELLASFGLVVLATRGEYDDLVQIPQILYYIR